MCGRDLFHSAAAAHTSKVSHCFKKTSGRWVGS